MSHSIQISAIDSLPNFVCNSCWQTTEAFHELYQKSKILQEKFLNPMIKIEIDTTDDLWHDGTEHEFADDPPFDVKELKSEPSSGGFCSYDILPFR